MKQGIERDFLLTGKTRQLAHLGSIDNVHLLPVTLHIYPLPSACQALGQMGRCFQCGQLLLPEALRCTAIPALQPLDVIAVAAHRLHGLATVTLQNFAE